MAAEFIAWFLFGGDREDYWVRGSLPAYQWLRRKCRVRRNCRG